MLLWRSDWRNGTVAVRSRRDCLLWKAGSLNTLQWDLWPVGSFRCCCQHSRIKPGDFIVSSFTFCGHLRSSPLIFLVLVLWVQKCRATKCWASSVFSQDTLTCRCDSLLMAWDIMTGCDWQIWVCGEIAHFWMNNKAWEGNEILLSLSNE